ncbi:MAG: hypothetical protein RR847_04440 [Bacilli bacterium]
MSNSNDLLNELRQLRYGKNNLKNKEVTNCKTMTLRLPKINKRGFKQDIKNFCLMIFITMIIQPIFLLLVYYFYSCYCI